MTPEVTGTTSGACLEPLVVVGLTHLWSLRWLWQLALLPVVCVRGTLLPKTLCMYRYIPLVVLPLILLPYLAMVPCLSFGPNLLPWSLSCVPPLLSPWCTAPYPFRLSLCSSLLRSLSGTDLQSLSLRAQPQSECLRWWCLKAVVLKVCVAHFMLFPPQSGCYNFVWGFEVPLLGQRCPSFSVFLSSFTAPSQVCWPQSVSFLFFSLPSFSSFLLFYPVMWSISCPFLEV